MPAEILPTHTPALFDAAVRQAAEQLRAGQVVALPTETVYGLAANALDPAAVARIFQIKGRPSRNPIIVHVDSVAMARQCAAEWPPLADRFAAAFWPGPLTLVLRRAAQIPPIVTAGGDTVGLRWPSHPFIQAVIPACGFPLAAPSANRSSELSPTTAQHVQKQLGSSISLIVDGGQSQVGIESTVLDLSVHPPRILRPGMIHQESLLAVSGELAAGASPASKVLKSPGQLARHYAPKARLILAGWKDDADLRRQIRELGVETGKVCVIAHRRIPSGTGFGRVSVIPHDPEAFARAIYAELHQCDDAGAKVIMIESLPPGREWEAIVDRLKRAAT